MSSWVRYSVAVYLGLLISGALAKQPWAGPGYEPTNTPSVYHEARPPIQQGLPAEVTPTPNADVSV